MKKRKVPLECTICASHNYFIYENNKRENRLELNKYCKYCKKVTLHKETR